VGAEMKIILDEEIVRRSIRLSLQHMLGVSPEYGRHSNVRVRGPEIGRDAEGRIAVHEEVTIEWKVEEVGE
jgi:hypothetical protein